MIRERMALRWRCNRPAIWATVKPLRII
jgi:hypothetical protein